MQNQHPPHVHMYTPQYKIQAAAPYTPEVEHAQFNNYYQQNPQQSYQYPQQYPPQTHLYQQHYQPNAQEDIGVLIEKEHINAASIVAMRDSEKAKQYFLLGFLFPLIWLFNLRFRNSPNSKARAWWRRSLVLLILFIILVVVCSIVIPSAVANRKH
jgi:hypothetical protein